MSLFFLILYMLAWIVTLLAYQHRKKVLDAGWFVIACYTLWAVLAVVLWQTPSMYEEFWSFAPLTFLPFVYLFIMLRICMIPVTRFDAQTTKIEAPNMTILSYVSWFIIGCTVLQIPSLIDQLSTSGISNLLSDSDLGKELYSESMAEAEESGAKIENLLSIFSGAFADISVLLLYYHLTLKEKKRALIIGLLLALGLNLISPIICGQRSGVILFLLTIVSGYFLFRKYFQDKIRHWIDIAGISLMIVIFIPVFAITASRFDSRDSGSIGSIVYYVGQAPLNFNNYGLDDGGTRHGDRTLNLVKRIFDSSTPKNYVERRDKYPNLHIDDNVFYTYVGDFTIDFGPIWGTLILLLITAVITHTTRAKENAITFHQLLLIFLTLCVVVQGSFYLFAYADTNGLKIIVLLLLYILCKHTQPKKCQD